jgi:hypothetical protein
MYRRLRVFLVADQKPLLVHHGIREILLGAHVPEANVSGACAREAVQRFADNSSNWITSE